MPSRGPDRTNGLDLALAALPTDECVIWAGSRQSNGYGQVHIGGGKYQRAHRYFYERFVGSIPEGYEVDHLCFTKLCVNPAHLEAVTGRENTLRHKATLSEFDPRTHCRNGHARETGSFVNAAGKLRCRPCAVDNTHRYLERKMARV